MTTLQFIRQPTCLISESIEMFLTSRSRSVELRPLTPAGLLLLRNPAISPSNMALTGKRRRIYILCNVEYIIGNGSEIYREYSHLFDFHWKHMKSFIAKWLNSILVNLRYLRFKLLKYKENNKKICNTFDHNFKNIPLYIMRKVSLEWYYFVLYECALTSKISKMALKSFCDKTLHIMYA